MLCMEEVVFGLARESRIHTGQQECCESANAITEGD